MNKVYLKVDFKDKNQVKLLGGRWDSTQKQWYVPSGLDLINFSKWLISTQGLEIKPAESNQGVTLSQLLQKVSQLINHITPQLEWVKAEVSEISLHQATGHCYLELVEMHAGKLLSKAKAIIVKDNYQALFDRFKQVTGDILKPGMQVLLLVKLNFSIQHGFSLYIKDVDPAYTLGDLAAKLAEIRKILQQQGLYNKNKQLTLPSDFTKVAVLSPDAAAGLGDFKREAALLEHHGLCKFYYYVAQFQGADASSEITRALHTILVEHQLQDFDVIVIIRGGGSAIDLAWLNDYQIAKMICESQVVVYSGIGHERDNTIIDEVAAGKFDTPSKVIVHIFNTIVHNAQQAAANAKEIKNISNSIYINSYNVMIEQFNKTLKIAEISILNTNQRVEQQYTKMLADSRNIINYMATLIEQRYLRIYEYSGLSLKYLNNKLIEYIVSINQISPKMHLVMEQQLQLLWNNVTSWLYESYELNNNNLISKAKQLADQMANQHYQMTQLIQKLITNIISLGPRATLERGYTVVRNPLNQVVSSKLLAQSYGEMYVEFHDGMLKLINSED
jgi:exodeoxyribonuclease VII large subunit